ncbi:MAG TPA: hypothetical protein VFU13_16930 [Steroidobacteraceae bacterium]|nr:hypothetical protein [Steroidobacteraceae bacterium]
MNSVLIVVLLWLVPNIWASVRVARSGMAHEKKALLLLGVWFIPILGVTMALMSIPEFESVPASGPLPRAGEARERIAVAPGQIEYTGCGSFPVLEHLMNGNGVPILDWEALDRWAGGNIDAIERGRRAWLLHFRDSISQAAHLYESGDAWVLSTFQPATARAAAAYVSATRLRIEKLLDGLAEFPAGARSILVVLNSLDDYYRYVSNYHPDDGEFAFSGGMYINHGCPHFVTVHGKLSELEPVIAHEMTHSALAHLELPLWLDEGIAVTTEHRISTSNRHAHDDVEMIGRHLEFWNAERMQEFWTGTSFSRTDDGNALSYDLARHIVGLLGREWPSFIAFTANASRDDGGAAAALGLLKLDLGDIAAAALNVHRQPGWSPDPAVWKQAVGRTA